MARIDIRERMRRVIERWRASGKSKASFVRAQGLSRGKLEYWVRRLGEPTSRRRRGRGEGLSLIPVQVTDCERERAEIEIVLSNGDRVRVRADVPAEAVRGVINALRQAC
jgi:hypothetical protein